MSGKDSGGPTRRVDPTELPDAGLPEPDLPSDADEATDLTGGGDLDEGEGDTTDLHPAPLLGAHRPEPAEVPEPAGLAPVTRAPVDEAEEAAEDPEATDATGGRVESSDDLDGDELPLSEQERTEPPEPASSLEGEPEADAWPRVDALFAGELPPPPVEAGPRIRRLRRTLAVAIPLDVLGVCCWTGVPGAALTLYAWLLADGEVARVEAGEYTTEDAAQLMRLRTISAWTLGFCVVSLILQIVLFNSTLYGRFYDRLIDHAVRLFGL